MSHSDHQAHRAALEHILFDTPDATAPFWLTKRFHDCVRRYKGLRTTPEFEAALRAFASSQDRPFEPFVVGEGNFGKSTVSNALLGERASRVDTLAETRCFLRYALADEPSPLARVFARLDGDIHGWLKPLLGYGSETMELYDVLEYVVPLDALEPIISGEVDRCRADSTYSSAVLEIERQLRWSDRRLFRPGVRFVDTQGLDQQLPEDLVRMIRVDAGASTRERFEQWIGNTPRGRHLDWQYRRCDAALWCVNAKRVGSAVTGISLNYFRKYGKRRFSL